MGSNVAVAEATLDEAVLPERVQEALGQLVGAAREGLLALSVGVGLGVMSELLEEEVEHVVGPRGKHDFDRSAVRHGRESGEVTLGGRRVQVERPRVRTADGSREVRLATYEHLADRDLLSRVVLERMLAGVSTRRYARTQEPVGTGVETKARSTSKSSVSRAFVERTRVALEELMSRRLDDVRLAVMMLDGIELKGRTNIVALGITTEGVKIPLGLWEGSSENATVARALLSDLVERGLDTEQGILFVIDGSKALRKAIRDVFGQDAPVQRCVRHKERNVLEHLPERDRPPIKRRLRQAWAEHDHERARSELHALATELERSRPGAAASLREGLDETLTLTPARDPRQPEAHPREHEPVRVDDRDLPAHQPQHQALAIRRDVPALDSGRDARSRTPIPSDHRLPRPRQTRHRDRARTRSAHRPDCRTRSPLSSSPPNHQTRDRRHENPRPPGHPPASRLATPSSPKANGTRTSTLCMKTSLTRISLAGVVRLYEKLGVWSSAASRALTYTRSTLPRGSFRSPAAAACQSAASYGGCDYSGGLVMRFVAAVALSLVGAVQRQRRSEEG